MSANMDSIAPGNGQHDTQIGHEPHKVVSTFDVDEEDAVRKVEEATTPSADAQQGVRHVEAVTLTWSKSSLILAFICFWFLYLTNAFQSSITSNLTPYVTSGFEEHSLLTVIYIVSNSMAAAVYIPTAKLLDLWGRAEGFFIMVCMATLGLILMAVTQNLATFCAAQVFYTIGFGGMIYCVDVITADASSLKHRGLAFAFTSSPYMISAFAGPKAAEKFYENINWRWGFGCFAIILPFVATPLFVILKINLRKAKREGVLYQEPSNRSILQSVVFYLREFDAPGAFLLAAGLVIFLLPFTLADSAPNGWSTGYIIAMLVLGFVLLIAFGLHERFTAKKPFLPYNLLTSRTVMGGCLLSFTYQISYYAWASYFTSFLQVVSNLTIAEAGYVSATFDVLSGVLLLGIGFIISKTGYFRWLLFVAVPFYLLGQGLMIHFRQPGTSVGYLVMCQIFIAIGGAIIILCEQIAVMAAADHQHVASVLALLNIFGWLGGAVGNTISGAIWTNSFPQALERFLPEEELVNLEDIYGSLDVQLSYERGSPARLAIEQAYGFAQKRMLIAGTAIMGLTLVWIFMIKNINVAKLRQTKGLVF
ncbi:MFS general substrate transporter [Amniculicola lignicola CBS 123094]|uniref:MFS general substrate transporter n=1 Tax=Amniculicola lignicola CBS 123094 TaxID=1392246 RepID=A0A6A5WWC9_9PLEO|nr:MFS general substrate transporter [Amniculicola lignicola CBS 123094]